MSSQPDSAADNAPEVVKEKMAELLAEARATASLEDTSPVEDDSAQATLEQDVTDESTTESETADAETDDAAGDKEAVEEEATVEAEAEEEVIEEEVSDEVQEETAEEEESDEPTKQWYILKVQVNRENSIRDALERRTKIAGLEEFIGDVVVPTEEIAEFNKAGKRRIVKKKLFPGYIMVHMIINDDTWFLVRETPGIGDFTGAGGKPTPMDPLEVDRILKTSEEIDDEDQQVKTAIPFKTGDRVRVKDGYFLNFEGEVEGVDEASGRVTVMINIFGRSTPVELEHWQIEDV